MAGEPDVKLNGERHHDHRPSLRCVELEAMLIYSMSVSVDGFIADREGAFGWSAPSEEQFRFHIAQVRELGGYLCGRRLYETILVWETDPSMRENELGAAFADVWCAIPKVVFSRTLGCVQGNARLAGASVAEEAAAALDATDKDVSIGGAGLAAAAIELGLPARRWMTGCALDASRQRGEEHATPSRAIASRQKERYAGWPLASGDGGLDRTTSRRRLQAW